MKFALLTTLIAAAMLPAMQPSKPRIARASLASLEKGFDGRIARPGSPDPYDPLGNTRGVYLDGYGVVFTTELNLVYTPPMTPFRPALSKEDIENLYRKKQAKLAVLKQTMRDMLVSSASALDALPPGEQVVVAVTLFYYNWEQRGALPSQIVMQAPKSALLKGAGPELDAALHVEEF